MRPAYALVSGAAHQGSLNSCGGKTDGDQTEATVFRIKVIQFEVFQ